MSCRIASTILRGFRNGPLLHIPRAFSRKEHNSAAADPSIRPVQTANDSVPVFHNHRGFYDLFDIQAWEMSTGRIVAVEDLPWGVQRMMKKHGVTGAEHKSVASQLLSHFAAMGRAKIATPEWRAAQAKASWRDAVRSGGAKGRAAQAEAGYPGLEKGRATHAEAGYPGLEKGRATQNAKTKAADLLKSPDSLRMAMMRREYAKAYKRERKGKPAKISAQEETEVPVHEEIDASHSPKPKRRVSREAARK